MRAYIDTNVLLDQLISSRPDNDYAQTIFQMGRNGLIELFLSTQSIIDAAYISKREYHLDGSIFRAAIQSLSGFVNIHAIGIREMTNALKWAGEDLEDNAQGALADSTCCHIIISNDKDFFADPDYQDIPVYTPQRFVETIKALY